MSSAMSSARTRDSCLHGVTIRSPLDLGGPPGPGDPELTLQIDRARSVGPEPPAGTPVLELVAAGRRIHTGTVDGTSAVLRVHGLCDFVVHPDEGTVSCVPDPGATPAQLALLVRGSLLAFYLALTGACVLHASAVEVAPDGAAVAFVGRSGTGKSTLAGWLCRTGGRFVADDLVRLDALAPPGWVGCSGELRLRSAAACMASGRLDWCPHPTADGRTGALPPSTVRRTGPLAAVVLPRPVHDAGDIEVHRLDPVEAALTLAAFPRLGPWTSPSVMDSHLDGVSRLADSVPVYAARLPWGPPFRAELMLDLLDALGVPAPASSLAR
jgi:hypothetical protein